MLHIQDCCESVYIEDINGDLQSLVGSPILVAEERASPERGQLNEYDDDFEWTFYTIATVNGHVDIRWYGSSNGYYSTAVHFIKTGSDRW